MTASRRTEDIRQAPVAVDVITAEDIRNSGATNLWMCCAFASGWTSSTAGLWMAAGRWWRSGDSRRNMCAIFSASGRSQRLFGRHGRGLLGSAADPPGRHRTDRNSPGTQRRRLRLGAGLGLINIITKKPGQAARVCAGAGRQSLGHRYERFRGRAAPLPSAYRASYGSRQADGFPPATGGQANDFVHSNKANVRTVWTMAGDSKLEMFAGGSWYRSGIQSRAESESQFNQNFQMLKWTRSFGGHASAGIPQFAQRLHQRHRSIGHGRRGNRAVAVLQVDEEAVQRMDWWDARMNTVFGLNYRQATAQDASTFGAKSEQDEELWSGSVNQSARILRKLELSAASSWNIPTSAAEERSRTISSLRSGRRQTIIPSEPPIP